MAFARKHPSLVFTLRFFKRIHAVLVKFALDNDFAILKYFKLHAASAAAVAKSGLASNGIVAVIYASS